ncbi:lectin, mannose binding 2 like [Phyllostomus discolor]|uniref:Lectin, mannose binding 2 like n=1 Tax=Phyllostomus discolor TaxID=89673 RepID=A0A834E4Y8_9CHIR|nr:lectin, mannose binding 2 like [Phyllostomus discolor]
MDKERRICMGMAWQSGTQRIGCSQRVFPYISAMVNNGSLSYDHERDGRPTELGGCTAIVRNLHYDTFLVIRYVKRHLTIMMDIDGKHEWRDCIEVPGVRLPRGYYFGTSSITGDLSDNHDIISLKLFELTVERTPEEEKLHRDVFLPSVDNMKLPESEHRDPGKQPVVGEESQYWGWAEGPATLTSQGRLLSVLPLPNMEHCLQVTDEQLLHFRLKHLERESKLWLPEMGIRSWGINSLLGGLSQ